MSQEMSQFAANIYKYKYAHPGEEWADTAKRVATTVMGALGYGPNDPETVEIEGYIRNRQFMPGGRYLAATGRDVHQTQNCLQLMAEDSREGWAELLWKCAMALQTGAGIGVEYSKVRPKGAPIRRTGGVASGPLELMRMVNEVGRGIMQGGSRRSAIWAGLNWNHADINDFVHMKDWPAIVREAKAKDFNFPALMDMTNISVGLDDLFFEAYRDPSHVLHEKAKHLYADVVKQMFTTAEPGFSINLGDKAAEVGRNAPVAAGTRVLTSTGYRYVGDIVDGEVAVWTGKRWAMTTFKRTGVMVPTVRVSFTGGRSITCDPTHEFILDDGRRVPAQDLKSEDSLLVSLPKDSDDFGEFDSESYTLGFLYGDGSFRRGLAEVTLCTDDKKACRSFFSENLKYTVTEVDGRGYTRIYYGKNPLFDARTKERVGTDIMLGDYAKKKSFLAGLFDADGSYDPKQHRVRLCSKHRPFLEDVQRLLEELGILASINVGSASGFSGNPSWMLVVNGEYVIRFAAHIPCKRVKAEGYTAYRKSKLKVLSIEDDVVQDVFCCDVGVEEHSFMAEGVIISNCTEITTADDSDICNLGSINLSRVTSLEEMRRIVKAGTLFLIAGTLYSDLPYPKVGEIRKKNRRLGLGLMGIHEWLLQRGHRYGANDELATWMDEYAKSGEYAAAIADKHQLTVPVATRAIAPTGTISIVAETTSGIEPIFCAAYKRRYLVDGKDWKFQYVIDPTARRLVAQGVNPDSIEDAYSLSYDFERRVSFQAWLQGYVDHAISSTINMPSWGTPANDADTLPLYADILMKYLPKLRGITVYPDGCRGGQPLVPVSYHEAVGKEGLVFEETEERCVGGVCGT